MAGIAALWTLASGLFFIYSLYAFFKGSKISIFDTKQKAGLLILFSPVLWIMGIGTLLMNDTQSSVQTAKNTPIATQQKQDDVAINQVPVVENAKPGLLGLSDNIKSVSDENGTTKIVLKFNSAWSAKDFYVYSSTAIVEIGKYIQAHPDEFKNNKFEIGIQTDMVAPNGQESEGYFATFAYNKKTFLDANYKNIIFAQMLNISDKHWFSTVEAKRSFHEWCDDKSGLNMAICNQ